jgi:hypothetical protein
MREVLEAAIEPINWTPALRGARALAGLAFVVAHAATAAQANLLANGDFSQENQLTGWTCSSGSWISDDADSIAGSGSMWLKNFLTNAGSCTSGCLAVRGGAAYSLGGQSRVLFGNPVISFECASSYTTQCNSFTYDVHGPAMPTSSTWSPSVGATGVLEPGVQSLMCTVTLGSSDHGDIWGHFDNLFFTTDVIFFEGFESP